jgi:hypothetical protein
VLPQVLARSSRAFGERAPADLGDVLVGAHAEERRGERERKRKRVCLSQSGYRGGNRLEEDRNEIRRMRGGGLLLEKLGVFLEGPSLSCACSGWVGGLPIDSIDEPKRKRGKVSRYQPIVLVSSVVKKYQRSPSSLSLE